MSARKDLTNQKFGQLVALRFERTDGKYAYWLCQCNCGREVAIRGTSLTSGNTTQCVHCQARGNQNAVKHGHSRATDVSPTYQSWKAMMARCYHPKNASWEYYGGKGIKVYERGHDFRNFLADMGERLPGTVLDRIDLNGDYEPVNMRWVTPKESRANQGFTPRPPENLSGKRFGRLIALRLSHVHKGHAHWVCLCDCGTETIKPAHNLKRGRVASCGCLRRS
jgi:hypothetical protein